MIIPENIKKSMLSIQENILIVREWNANINEPDIDEELDECLEMLDEDMTPVYNIIKDILKF